MASANKTKETVASVDAFLKEQKPASRVKDCQALRGLMESASGEPARMWGPGIVGFGVRRYRYDSGREGEICKIGFASRATALVLYGMWAGEPPSEKAAAALGKVKLGKGCLYIKTLADVDMKKLEAMIRRAAKAAD